MIEEENKSQQSTYVYPNDIFYTEDIMEAMDNRHNDACLHLVITQGEVTFSLDGHAYTAHTSDCIIKPGSETISNVHASEDCKMQGVIVSNRFLRLCSQDESYKTKGLLSMLANPIMPMTEAERDDILSDIQQIRRRFENNYHTFHMQVLKRTVETMILDMQDIHSRLNPDDLTGVSQAAKILRSFIGYLQTGLYRRERKVDYYAALLFITPKYLSEACIKASGHNASFWIDRYTTEEVARLMLDTEMTFTQIADRMHFSSMNYFTRYVKRTLGMLPSEYRTQMVGKR